MEERKDKNTKINAKDYSVKGKIQIEREKARKELAKSLLRTMAIIIVIAIITGSVLLYLLPPEKFAFRDMLNLVLAVSSVFSGLLGAAITFYFMTKD